MLVTQKFSNEIIFFAELLEFIQNFGDLTTYDKKNVPLLKYRGDITPKLYTLQLLTNISGRRLTYKSEYPVDANFKARSIPEFRNFLAKEGNLSKKNFLTLKSSYNGYIFNNKLKGNFFDFDTYFEKYVAKK